MDRMSQLRMDCEARVPRYWPKSCRGGNAPGGMRPNRYGITIVITIPDISGPKHQTNRMTQKLDKSTKRSGRIREIRFDHVYSDIPVS
ncbi:hypothetical protein TNCV_1799011 [Trichonephila clavipes]|uniref:Uncharacterized protein n=1 Tax=Trichonephila clavipes TaxID=2585209 RepID=A0A8X6SF43_TRICX|nr:hypothetical protein TNCV_1799011 [Trichonephila clavipes]